MDAQAAEQFAQMVIQALTEIQKRLDGLEKFEEGTNQLVAALDGRLKALENRKKTVSKSSGFQFNNLSSIISQLALLQEN